MTDNEIIKALENVLDLIKRSKAKNEKLRNALMGECMMLSKCSREMNNLYGFINLKCPVCNTEHVYYVGRNATDEQFKDEFTESERTCSHCNRYTFNTFDTIIHPTKWDTDYIVEALSGELENQNRHSQTHYPEQLYKVLKAADITDKDMINKILLMYFKDILKN